MLLLINIIACSYNNYNYEKKLTTTKQVSNNSSYCVDQRFNELEQNSHNFTNVNKSSVFLGEPDCTFFNDLFKTCNQQKQCTTEPLNTSGAQSLNFNTAESHSDDSYLINQHKKLVQYNGLLSYLIAKWFKLDSKFNYKNYRLQMLRGNFSKSYDEYVLLTNKWEYCWKQIAFDYGTRFNTLVKTLKMAQNITDIITGYIRFLQLLSKNCMSLASTNFREDIYYKEKIITLLYNREKIKILHDRFNLKNIIDTISYLLNIKAVNSGQRTLVLDILRSIWLSISKAEEVYKEIIVFNCFQVKLNQK